MLILITKQKMNNLRGKKTKEAKSAHFFKELSKKLQEEIKILNSQKKMAKDERMNWTKEYQQLKEDSAELLQKIKEIRQNNLELQARLLLMTEFLKGKKMIIEFEDSLPKEVEEITVDEPVEVSVEEMQQNSNEKI